MTQTPKGPRGRPKGSRAPKKKSDKARARNFELELSRRSSRGEFPGTTAEIASDAEFAARLHSDPGQFLSADVAKKPNSVRAAIVHLNRIKSNKLATRGRPKASKPT